MTDGGPPGDAYGRVTNAERFRALWATADDLLDRLEARYDVQREEGPEIDPDLAGTDGRTKRIVRLSPAAGAPLVVAYTTFPGLTVRFGLWHVRSFPACGCDACDEDPHEEATELAELVDAIVAGDFTEKLSLLRPGRSFTFRGNAGWSRLTRAEVRRLGGPQEVHWAPWPTTAGE